MLGIVSSHLNIIFPADRAFPFGVSAVFPFTLRVTAFAATLHGFFPVLAAVQTKRFQLQLAGVLYLQLGALGHLFKCKHVVSRTKENRGRARGFCYADALF